MHDYHAEDLCFVQLPPATDGLGATQRLQHHDGATQVEHKRDDEAHCLYEDHHLGQVRFPLLGREVLEAVSGVVLLAWGRVQQEPRGEAPRQHQHPHTNAHYPSVALGPQRPWAKRVYDGQKAIHADAGEEEDAAVHVGVEQRDGELAQRASKRPVLVDEVEDPQRQRADEQQVRHHQVHHVGRGLISQL